MPLFRATSRGHAPSRRDNDANRVVLLILTIVLSLVILVTVAGELTGGAAADRARQKLLIVATLVAGLDRSPTWSTRCTTRICIIPATTAARTWPGSIFPGERPEPDYGDFVYFAFTLGVALQTSDVAITSPAHPPDRDDALRRRLHLQPRRAALAINILRAS